MRSGAATYRHSVHAWIPNHFDVSDHYHWFDRMRQGLALSVSTASLPFPSEPLGSRFRQRPGLVREVGRLSEISEGVKNGESVKVEGPAMRLLERRCESVRVFQARRQSVPSSTIIPDLLANQGCRGSTFVAFGAGDCPFTLTQREVGWSN